MSRLLFILLRFLLACCSVLLLQSVAYSHSGTILPKELIQNGGYIISDNGKILDQHRPNDLFISASTIKLLTALTALDILGEDFRFTTSFFLDSKQVLYIRGSGDPTLTSESLAEIASKLKRNGLQKVSAYVLDDSAFQLEHSLPTGSVNSANPYDVPNSALAANFNAIAMSKNQDGSILSSEPQTPLTPLAKEISKQLSPGKHHVNIGSFHLQGEASPSLRYIAELMHSFLVQEGIASTPAIRAGSTPKNSTLIYQYESRQRVKDIVQSCMKYSNNFIANQLALSAGARQYGFPATWDKARRTIKHYAQTQLGIPDNSLFIEEGSGLSRKNKITPSAMLKVLDAFEKYRNLLPEKHGGRLKSGTLDAVYCYAGYIENGKSLVSFALLLNQKKNTRDLLLKKLQQTLTRQHLKKHPSKIILQ